jgi:hypothetical protein
MNKLKIMLLTLLPFWISSCKLAELNGYKEAQKAITNIEKNVIIEENLPQPIISFKKQVEKHWYLPTDLKDNNELKDIRVILYIALNPDGTVKEVNVKDTIRPTNSEWLCEIIVESAVEAVKKGSPYKLPSAEYNIWKEFNMVFSPNPW